MPNHTRTGLKMIGNRSDGVISLNIWFESSSVCTEEIGRELAQ